MPINSIQKIKSHNKSKATKYIHVFRGIHQVHTNLRLKEVKDYIMQVSIPNNILCCTITHRIIIFYLFEVFIAKMARIVILSLESDHTMLRSVSL